MKGEACEAAKGKAKDTNTGGSPGYQRQPNSLETQVVRK